MYMSYKRVYFSKNKKPKNIPQKSDPITNGIRTGLLTKIDTIYQEISRLHNQNISVRKAKIAKLSCSVPKILQKNPNQQTTVSRIRTEHSQQRKTCSQIFRKTSFSNRKLQTETNFYNYKKHRQNQNSLKFKCPSTHSRIRQLLKCRQKLQQEQNENLMKNPYYKIMKKRFKTQHQPEKSQSTDRQQNSLLCTQYLSEKIQDIIVLPNKYSDNLIQSQRKNSQSQSFTENPNIRQKSQTKIYQEIKKYFQEKYGSAKNEIK